MSDVKRSQEFNGPGFYQFEFIGDKIAIAEWDQIPPSTNQWVRVDAGGPYYFVGTNVEDISIMRSVNLTRRSNE